MMERKRELPIATSDECEAIRNDLIFKGMIEPMKPGAIQAQTKKLRKQEREQLIDLGIIDPELCPLSIPVLPRPRAKDEGEYKPMPISNDDEYFRRRQVYFRMIQEILQSRRELKLILGPRGNNDPEWIF
jgi:hypothetical protein